MTSTAFQACRLVLAVLKRAMTQQMARYVDLRIAQQAADQYGTVFVHNVAFVIYTVVWAHETADQSELSTCGEK